MRLFEYEGKELFSKYGILVPRSRLVRDESGVLPAVEEIGLPAVLKAQVLSGGRGKAGGVVVVGSRVEAEREAARVLGISVGGEPTSALLVEELCEHSGEMYLSISLDRGRREFVALASRSGGTEIDATARAGMVESPVPLDGLTGEASLAMSASLGLEGRTSSEFISILLDLERLCREEECELTEVNPLAVGADGGLIALDSKVVLDDNALFRHPEFSQITPEDPLEGQAAKFGFAFVRLGGEVAVVGNGAGLVLSTLDLVADMGGTAACFLDLGGGAQIGRVEEALRLVRGLHNTRAVLLNIFGGITRTTDVAEAVKEVLSEAPMMVPIFARISGVEEEEARSLLAASGVRVFSTAREAVTAAVKGVSS